MSYVIAMGIDGLFYFLIIWLIYKVRNKLLINKLNIKGQYKFLKEEAKKNKSFIYFSKIFKILLIIIYSYLMFGILLLIFVILINFMTLGGAAYVDTGADSTFYDKLMDFFKFYITDLFSFINIFFFINLFTKSIIFNYSIYDYIKKNEIQLKEKETINLSENKK